jgi:DNA repair protein RadC
MTELFVIVYLEAAGQLLGVRLRDHIIVTEDGYFSFREHGLIL